MNMKTLNRFVVQFKNDWVQFIPKKGLKWNWYSFNFIYIYFEYEKMTEGLEFIFCVLGLGVFIRYNLPASDKIFAKWEKEAKEIKKTKKAKKKDEKIK